MLIACCIEAVDGPAYLPGVGGTEIAQHSRGQDTEPHLDLVQPGSMGGRVVKMDVGVAASARHRSWACGPC